MVGCDSGDEALEKMLREAWDVAILDVAMPGLDGLEVRRRARAMKIETPVLILTGARVGAPDEVEALEEAKADEFVRKPYEPDVLRVRVAKLAFRAPHAAFASGAGTSIW